MNAFIFQITMIYAIIIFLFQPLYWSYITIDEYTTQLWSTWSIITWNQDTTVWSEDSSEDRVRLDQLYQSTTEEVSVWSWEDQRDIILMERVCKYGRINGRVSPMCDNWEMYYQGKQAFAEKPNARPIALGIMYSESHLWVNYAWSCDQSWNNRGGIKGKKLDNWKLLRDQPIPNNGKWWPWWCRLYRFDNMSDYFKSKANTLIDWYWPCFDREKPIECIAYNYVGNPRVAEKSWIRRVAKISE